LASSRLPHLSLRYRYSSWALKKNGKSLEGVAILGNARFSGSFEPLFDSFLGGYINIDFDILPFLKEGDSYGVQLRAN
jgi:hypothetical protein